MAWEQTITPWSAATPSTSGSFTPSNLDDLVIVLTLDGGSSNIPAYSGTGGGAWFNVGPTKALTGFHVSVGANLTVSATSQTITTAATAGSYRELGWVYSAATSISDAGAAIVTSPGTGTGAIVGSPVFVPTGCILLACLIDTTGAATLSSPAGTNRGNSSIGGTPFCITEYAGSGAFITPTFTTSVGTHTFDIVQILISGLPIITSQPVAETVASGSTASFAVSATSATSFQWQSAPITSLYSNTPGTFSNVSGATSASLTTGTLTSANNGQWYQCLVTNASGTIATLPTRVWILGQPSAGKGSLLGSSWFQEYKIRHVGRSVGLLTRQFMGQNTQQISKLLFATWFFGPQTNTYNVAVTEAGAATDATLGVSGSNVILEAETATDSVVPSGSFHIAVTEAGTAVDTPSDIATLPNAIAEAGSAADVVSSPVNSVSILNEKFADDGFVSGLSVATPAFTNNATPGSTILCFITCSATDTRLPTTVTDGTQTFVNKKVTLNAGAAQNMALYILQNNTSSAKMVVTATYSLAQTGKGIWVVELGALLAASYDNSDVTAINAPGTGANAVAGTAITPVTPPAYLFSLVMECEIGNGSDLAAGTGFTADTSGWAFGGANVLAKSQFQPFITPATAAKMTAATNGATGGYLVGMFLLDPAGGNTYSVSAAETGTAADSESALGTFGTAVTEAGAATDVESSVATFPRTVTEAGTAADAETAVAVFPEALTETGTAADTETGIAVFPEAIAEAGTVSDSASNVAVLPNSMSEAGAASDAESDTAVLPNTISESGASSDTTTGVPIYPESVSEAGTAADTDSAVAVFPESVSEAGSGADSTSAIGSFHVAASETGTATDVSVGAPVYPEAMVETGTASDTETDVLVATGTITDSGTAVDSQSNVGTFPSAVAESGTAVDSNNAVPGGTQLVSESGTATDSAINVISTQDHVTETGVGADSVSDVAVLGNTLTETGTAADTESATSSFPESVTESGAATDSDSAIAVFPEALTETGTATDSTNGSNIGAVSVITETGTAADSSNATPIYVASVTESGNGTDVITSVQTSVVLVTETETATDVISTLQNLVASLLETGAATDSIIGSISYKVAFTETEAAADTIAEVLMTAGQMSETVAATDSSNCLLLAAAVLSDAGSADASVSALMTAINSLLEAGTSIDELTANFTSFGNLIEVGNALDAYAIGQVVGLVNDGNRRVTAAQVNRLVTVVTTVRLVGVASQTRTVH